MTISAAPEFATWRGLYDVAHAALAAPEWTRAVPGAPDIAAITLPSRATTDLVARLFACVALRPPRAGDAVALVEAAIAERADAIEAIAARLAFDAGVAGTVATFAAMPLLHACRLAWESRVAPEWIDAACPICGTWAAIVEARGLERSLRHRCGRCGADWNAQVVRCGFCGMREHARLTTLVPEAPGAHSRIEACLSCRGYMKTITTLTACAPHEVSLRDLETVALDVAALEQGFARPARR